MIGAFAPHAARPGADDGAALGRVERVEDDEPGVVDPAIGILEAESVAALQRPPTT